MRTYFHPEQKKAIKIILNNFSEHINDWQISFLNSISKRETYTDKEYTKLLEIYKKLGIKTIPKSYTKEQNINLMKIFKSGNLIKDYKPITSKSYSDRFRYKKKL